MGSESSEKARDDRVWTDQERVVWSMIYSYICSERDDDARAVFKSFADIAVADERREVGEELMNEITGILLPGGAWSVKSEAMDIVRRICGLEGDDD